MILWPVQVLKSPHNCSRMCCALILLVWHFTICVIKPSFLHLLMQCLSVRWVQQVKQVFYWQKFLLCYINPICLQSKSVLCAESLSILGDDMQKAWEVKKFLIFGYLNLQHFFKEFLCVCWSTITTCSTTCWSLLFRPF